MLGLVGGEDRIGHFYRAAHELAVALGDIAVYVSVVILARKRELAVCEVGAYLLGGEKAEKGLRAYGEVRVGKVKRLIDGISVRVVAGDVGELGVDVGRIGGSVVSGDEAYVKGGGLAVGGSAHRNDLKL